MLRDLTCDSDGRVDLYVDGLDFFVIDVREKVFAACAEHGVAVEINGFPRRQDLDRDLAAIAVAAGCEVVLASDAHAVPHLEFDGYAAAIAMLAEVPRERVINVKHADELEVWLAEG